ncbi:fumarylacetoacetate hydrolase family protein [Sandarakinorhabdus sp.]|jgi:2,4-diketo-3-deoxy-L-fuconate hydrolase|uniref:fumarylacetoacetate hydrolase family protein n=1 Tax=Sandarakinorhabdus sp. TaxID=1916663 RepID=UPI0028ABF176|nr:fumarylacetoacetate hydrolase family protein [Sandarakinorhabdus sp.]
MKLFRHGAPGAERPGLVAPDGSHRDLTGIIADVAGPALLSSDLQKLRGIDAFSLPALAPGFRFGPCVGHVPKFICVGLNYADHAAETGATVPPEPVLFMKGVNAICGPNDDLEIPRGSTKTDWEVELGVVIGAPVKYVSEADALSHVAGYCIVHDVSERAFQMERQGQWVKGKSHDSFGPIGPYLVTPEDVPNPQALDLWLEVDGHRYQQGNTRTMVYGVAHLIAYISQFMTLQTGDIISTGTPPGVGLGQTPPVYLRAGQEVRLGINGLGEQRQRTVPA